MLKVFSNLNKSMILCGLLVELALSELLHVLTTQEIPDRDTALWDVTECVWKGKRAIMQHPRVALAAPSM